MIASAIVPMAVLSVTSLAFGYLMGYLRGRIAEARFHEQNTVVCDTPDEDPRDGWTPSDGAGYIPTEEREKSRSCQRCGQSSRRSICRDCRSEADTVRRKWP